MDSRRKNMKKSPAAQLPSPPPLSTPHTSSENKCGSPLSTPTKVGLQHQQHAGLHTSGSRRK